MWIYTSTPPTPSWRSGKLVKHKYNYTLLLIYIYMYLRTVLIL
jgi:hypothetical protein